MQLNFLRTNLELFNLEWLQQRNPWTPSFFVIRFCIWADHRDFSSNFLITEIALSSKLTLDPINQLEQLQVAKNHDILVWDRQHDLLETFSCPIDVIAIIHHWNCDVKAPSHHYLSYVGVKAKCRHDVFAKVHAIVLFAKYGMRRGVEGLIWHTTGCVEPCIFNWYRDSKFPAAVFHCCPFYMQYFLQ